VKRIIKEILKSIVHRTGFDIVRYQPHKKPVSLEDLTDREIEIVESVRPFTYTDDTRVAALMYAVGYITDHKIPGNIAECGVWRGGSMMAVARALMSHGDSSRHLYLYDTFDGMPEPTEHDKRFSGEPAQMLLDREPVGTGVWCLASIEDVRTNMLSTGYPEEMIHFIKGKVEETLPSVSPDQLALLRLDTDWYESTKHELIHLFPLLDSRGLLIIDDYGHWQGVRKAIDEYFSEHQLNLYLHRVDYSCRVAVRTGA
jgi:O-methyltransferase